MRDPETTEAERFCFRCRHYTPIPYRNRDVTRETSVAGKCPVHDADMIFDATCGEWEAVGQNEKVQVS